MQYNPFMMQEVSVCVLGEEPLRIICTYSSTAERVNAWASELYPIRICLPVSVCFLLSKE